MSLVRANSELHAGGRDALAKLGFPLSQVKPQTPLFLYKGWKYVAEHPQVVINGWRKCGLLKGFDPEFKDDWLSMAKAAVSTPGSMHYPLFPKKVVPDGEEPEPGESDHVIDEDGICEVAVEAVEREIHREQLEEAQQVADAATHSAAAPAKAKQQWAALLSGKQ